jgi:hypothetical protein
VLAAVALLATCVAGCAGTGAPSAGSDDGVPTVYGGALRVTPDPVRVEATSTGCVRSVSLELANTDPGSPLRVRDVDGTREAFSLSAPLPLDLPPGGKRSFDLVFAPSQPGDASGILRIRTGEPEQPPYELAVEARGVARTPAVSASGPVRAVDWVFVLDISTTMDELARLREAIRALFDVVEAGGLDLRVGLVTFENDVLAHAGGAFLERDAFLRELDSQLVEGTWVPDPELPRQLLNFDYQENVLDALHLAATAFAFRPDARHLILLMTDDTFLEPPAEYSDGTPALHSYGEVETALATSGARLYSVHSRERGRGLSSGHAGRPSLVQQTGGAWFELSQVDSGALVLENLLGDLVAGPVCE